MIVSDSWKIAPEERFAELREEDARRAPDFTAMYETAVQASEQSRSSIPLEGRRARTTRWTYAATILAAAAIAGILLLTPDPDADFEALVSSYSVDFGGSRWQSPTDGLLDAPGMNLIRTVPSIEGSFRLPSNGRAEPVGNDA